LWPSLPYFRPRKHRYIYFLGDKRQKRIFNQNLKEDNKNFNLVAKGNLNILNKKINFREISVDDNYKATKEDLAYFKGAFESILFEKSFIEIFNLKKIKKFIQEIS